MQNSIHQTLCKSLVYVCRWCLLCLRTLGSQKTPAISPTSYTTRRDHRVRTSVTTAFGNETFSHIVPSPYLPCICRAHLRDSGFLPYTMLLEFGSSTYYSSGHAFHNLINEARFLPRFWEACSRNDFLEITKGPRGRGALIVNFWRHLRQSLIFKGGNIFKN